MPKSSRKLVTEVRVDGKRNPQDDGDTHAFMTSDESGRINVYPSDVKPSQPYFEGTMIHETGHALSNGKWGPDVNDKRWDTWKAAINSDGVHVSQYAKKSPQEAFAETYQLYNTPCSPEQFEQYRARYPAQFKVIADLLAEK